MRDSSSSSSSSAPGAAVKIERGLRYGEEETGGAGKGKAADDDGVVNVKRRKVRNKVEEREGHGLNRC